ncbi:SPOR domain-containing protein [Novosphingobium profundi]|nr:SPOR domain-containing protein [Novosphingobium profundi]
MLDAGNAARELGDLEASRRFFERARNLAPAEGRIDAGMARTAMLSGDPVNAIKAFEVAEQKGVSGGDLLSDHGLALDMAGDNAAAQALYTRALALGDNAQVRQRMAISQAIGGDLAASEQTLMPLLREQDKPAWRTRAFTLAISGDTKEAIKLAERILPGALAEEIAPYLRYMPRLTPAQQAAAANLGRFPRSSEIGRDSASIAAYAPARPVAKPDTALVPTGAPLGSASTAKTATRTPDRRSGSRSLRLGERTVPDASSQRAATNSRKPAKVVPEAESERVAPPEPKPGIEISGATTDANGELLPIARGSTPQPASAAWSGFGASVQPAAVRSAPVGPVAASPAARAPIAPGFVAQAGPAPSLPATAAAPKASAGEASLAAAPPVAPPVQAPAPRPSLSEAFADLGKPVVADTPIAGAVDLRKIIPARAAPPPPPPPPPAPEKPKKPAHPSRIWVQIGVGQDTKAIAFDWNRYQRHSPALFKGREAHVTAMGQTNRILVGPFDTRQSANDFVTDFGKAGNGTALVWTSPAGQVIDELEAAK